MTAIFFHPGYQIFDKHSFVKMMDDTRIMTNRVWVRLGGINSELSIMYSQEYVV